MAFNDFVLIDGIVDDIPDKLKEILFGVKENNNIVEDTVENYRITFGKYSGKTLLEINEIDPGYIRWAKENLDREPVKTLLGQL